MTERIAIVGASVRAAATSAVRAGFEVAAADLFGDEDLCHIAAATQIADYPDGLAAWLQALSPPPVAWMYTGALENYPDLVDQMAQISPLWGNDGQALREVRSSWRLSAMLREAGLRFPETRASSDGLPRDGSWLVKTGRGASGSGVAALGDEPARSDAFFQQRISGVPCSAVYIATGGKSFLLGTVRQLIGEHWLHARAFQYCGAIGPWPVSTAVRAEICRIGDVLANRFGLVGVFGIDFIWDGHRVWTIEVNPRFPASSEILERATGVQVLAAHAAACRASTLPDEFIANVETIQGKAILFAPRGLIVTNRMRAVLDDVDSPVSAPWRLLGDVPRVGARIETARPAFTVFAEGATAEEVVDRLKARVAILEQQLYLH